MKLPISELFLVVCFGFLTGAISGLAGTDRPEVEPALRAALREAGVSEAEARRALPSALWNTHQTAAAVAVHRPAASRVFVFLRQPGDRFQTVDVSQVESGNFGKLGRSRSEYTRFETAPVKWLRRDDGFLQVLVRTRAWVGRQRYTVSEPLVIRPDGTPVWR